MPKYSPLYVILESVPVVRDNKLSHSYDLVMGPGEKTFITSDIREAQNFCAELRSNLFSKQTIIQVCQLRRISE